MAGDTAAVAEIVHQSSSDFPAILLVALAVNLLILVRRPAGAGGTADPVGCTVLSVVATLGLTVWLFQIRLGHPG